MSHQRPCERAIKDSLHTPVWPVKDEPVFAPLERDNTRARTSTSAGNTGNISINTGTTANASTNAKASAGKSSRTW